MSHRPLCEPCPWRDMAAMRADHSNVVEHAENGNTHGFVCHTRCGPCDGPTVALKRERVTT